MFTRAKARVVLSVLLLGVAHAGEVTLVDFETPEHASVFARTAHPAARVTDGRASQGARALELSFRKYVSGAPQWPGLSFALADVGAPTDCSDHMALVLDVRTPHEDARILRVLVRSGEGKANEWYTRVPVQPGDWTTLRLPLAEMAATVDLTAVTHVMLYMTRPSRPTVFFVDNIRLQVWELEDPQATEVILVAPAFNDGYYHSNPETHLAARVALKAPPSLFRGATASLHVAGQQEQAGSVFDGRTRHLTLSLPKPQLGDGESTTATVELKREGQVLKRREFTITQFPPAADEVVLRDDGVTLVNGQPFFPFGMYQSPVAEFDTLKRMGFNTVHTYVPADAEYMQAARKAGLRVVSAVKGTYSEPPNYHEPKWRSDDVAAFCRSLMDSPALLAYYMFDEPSPGHTPQAKLRELADIPRGVDPYHLSVGCNNAHQLAYRGVTDAMMVDSYPVPGPMTQLVTRASDGRRAQEPNRALWFIPQAFSWEPYCVITKIDKAGRPVLRRGRPPTFDEVRTMPWISIALGAKGLVYYSWQTQGFWIRDAYPMFWRGFEHHVRELVALFPWLLEREPERPVVSSSSGVLIAARQRGNDLFVVAANTSLEPTQATLTIPGLSGRSLHVVSEDRVLQPVGDAVSLSFLGVETHLLTTSVDGLPKLPTLAEIRGEQTELTKAFQRKNPSVCTFTDGASLAASWGFPDPSAVKWASWYRMIDGWPGTPWIVGSVFRGHLLEDWKRKDFAAAGRWIEVRFAEPRPVNAARAIVSPWAKVELQIPRDEGWRTVAAERIDDNPARHHRHPSCTVTASFDPVTIDRFRVVFPERRAKTEVVFELSAARVE